MHHDASLWCNVLHPHPLLLTMPNHAKPASNAHDAQKSIRTSVSLPPDLHDTLERMAKDKKVSVAWVIRDAAEKYVSEQWPLLQRARA